MVKFVRCKRCGRKLTDTESQERGYGPICFLLIKENKTNKSNLFDFITSEVTK